MQKKVVWHYSFKSYLSLIWKSFWQTTSFPDQIAVNSPLVDGLFLVITNLAISFLCSISLQALQTGKVSLLFLGITQGLLYLPLALAAVFIFSLTLFILAKLLKGKGSLLQTFKLSCFASSGILIAWVPNLILVSLIITTALILIQLEAVHRFGKLSAVAVILFPIVAGLVLKVLLDLA